MSVILIRFARLLLWLIYAWITLMLVLLLFAFLLQLFGANPDAGFVEWVYRSVQRAMAPFRGIFEDVPLSDSSTLDLSILFAMIAYGFVGLALHAAVEWATIKLRAAERAEARDKAALASGAAASSSQRLWSGPDSASRTLQLIGSDGSSASISLSPHGAETALDVDASGLDPARSYAVWVDDSTAGRTGLGTFRPDASGSARVSLRTAAPLGEARRLGLAALPHAGESRPVDVLAIRVG